ncbi:c-type cytochrome [Ramlibacter sp.]|uniref:c-type cytochrome n=1 Tax=Ramlibacter sp. TaxID=1917967 RepID=UPI003D097F5C
MRKRSILVVALVTTVALGVLGACAAAVVLYAGLYDVASTRQHWQVTHSLLEFAMHKSVKLRARDIPEPPLTDEQAIARGASCFRAKCEQCHGAPGVSAADFGKSMQPLPGPLVDARRHWRPRELYWLTRYGIKMSGMPAWEYRLTDAELWDVVAFLQRLPDVDAAGYAAYAKPAPGNACGRGESTPVASPAVDAVRGRQALHQYGCNACHIIPGVIGSYPHVGPPLGGMGSRKLIAGTLANSPENLARWIVETQRVKPGTAMPQLNVAPQDARDMAAYLGTLRANID